MRIAKNYRSQTTCLYEQENSVAERCDWIGAYSIELEGIDDDDCACELAVAAVVAIHVVWGSLFSCFIPCWSRSILSVYGLTVVVLVCCIDAWLWYNCIIVSLVVASSICLSSRIRIKRGKRNAIPLLSCITPIPALCEGDKDKSANLISHTYTHKTSATCKIMVEQWWLTAKGSFIVRLYSLPVQH